MAATKTRRSPFALGLSVILGIAVVAALIGFKEQIGIALAPGEQVTVHLAENYGVRAYNTEVKIAGIKVGEVTDVAPAADGATVTAEIDDEEYAKLRSRPSARVRPATLLGGKYYLELIPGGQPGEFTGEIPRERSEVPVELDKVARALQPDTLRAARRDVRHLDRALDGDTQSALRELLDNAPDTLRPTGEVLGGLRGNRPETDLPRLVRGLHNTAAALTAQDGQLDAILEDLAVASDVLGRRSPELREALREMPSTLDSTRTGLGRLDTTLTKLEDTAGPARPAARELAATLERLEPLLTKARPLVADLDVALTDARPLVEDLVPTARGTTAMLDNLEGPVLKRVNGPVLEAVRSPWHGKGKYAGGGGDFPLYKAMAYALSGIAGGMGELDANGNQFVIAATAGPGSIAGLPVNLEQMFTQLMGLTERGPR